MPRLHLLHAVALAASLAACGGGGSSGSKSDTLPPTQVDCKKGSAKLTGHFTSPNGAVPVAGGIVTVASAPGCTASTGGDGAFELDGLTPGATTVTIERGHFHGSGPATPGTPVTVKIDATAVKIGYVPGDFDSIEAVVAGLGFTPVPLSMGALAQAATDLASYDVLLLNCGLDESYFADNATKAALVGWVNAGGVLYASDYAGIYVDSYFNGKVKYLSPDMYQGVDGTQTAKVEDEALARALGKTTAEINFDLGAWVVMNGVGTGTDVLLSGPVDTFDVGKLTGKPYAVQFAAGAGRVTFTSFHDEAQTTADMQTLLEQMVFGL
ncbi:MAG: carboxypeptidase-like regulatory domain-containing protein [Anaeromyxobacter sp.]